MDKFNAKHFAFLILAVTVVSQKTYPKVFILNGGYDSWVAVIISSVIILLYLIFFLKVCEKNNNYDFIAIYRTAAGQKLGKLLLCLFAMTLFLTLVESAAVEANSMHTNMLLETPVWFFILFFVIPAAYSAGRDLVSIVTITLIGITLINLAGMNLGMLTAPYKDTKLLFPIFADGITKGFILSILQILGLYGSLTIVFPYLTEIKDKRKLFLYSILGMVFVIQMLIVSITGAFMTFEITRLKSIPYPKLLQTQMVSHFRFIEAGELYVMLQIVGGWYIRYVVTFYTLMKILSALNLRHKYTIVIISFATGIAAWFVGNNLFVLFRFLSYYTYISLVNFFLIPFILFAIYAYKK
ncbi:GerAB/ArcD/ProY family transporter [Clostridium formicaceticum]|uniref:Spore germination protein n=1 Tax=Clostridium formicaceticum TaxID=1497 RepID=A0AAC9RPA7_9CLOT|nr:endospore germination permease [Clostridium formicaceticum]AOY78143.1 spore gernimation protein [Clostridium formicaceticum]ARE88795.1 Spore germination protein [Clostridium formicaceticum]